SARPWTGHNAIHALAASLSPLAQLEPLEVELDGLVFREVLSAVRVEGGIAANVVPARASAELNFRYAPGRSRDEAEARLRELVAGGELEILYNSPSAVPALTNPFVQRLRKLVPDVAPKQAWTPVAQFAEQGIDAINYGPGATASAHRQDEQVPIANLHAVYETLARFLSCVGSTEHAQERRRRLGRRRERGTCVGSTEHAQERRRRLGRRRERGS